MEINDALVTMITRELLKRLEAKGETSSGISPCAEKKQLVILGELSGIGAVTLAKLEESYCLIRHSGFEAAFPEDAQVLIPRLGIQALVRVSEGDSGCTPEGAALMWALLRGKKPVILEEGIEWRGFKSVMSPSLSAKYTSHERILASYGVVFAKEADLPSALSATAAKSATAASVAAATTFAETCPGQSCECAPIAANPSHAPENARRKKVINETELMRLCPDSSGAEQSIEIGTNDILTPLAKDYIAKMRITVNRVG